MDPHPKKSTRNPVTLHQSPILKPQRGQHHSLPQGCQLPPSWFICLRANFIGSKGKECAGFVTFPMGRTHPPLPDLQGPQRCHARVLLRSPQRCHARVHAGVLPAPHLAPIHCSYSTPNSQGLPQPPDEISHTPVIVSRHHPLSSPLRNECPLNGFTPS